MVRCASRGGRCFCSQQQLPETGQDDFLGGAIVSQLSEKQANNQVPCEHHMDIFIFILVCAVCMLFFLFPLVVVYQVFCTAAVWWLSFAFGGAAGGAGNDPQTDCVLLERTGVVSVVS